MDVATTEVAMDHLDEAVTPRRSVRLSQASANAQNSDAMTDGDFEQLVATLNQQTAEETQEMKRLYHQGTTPLIQLPPTSNLWHFPNADHRDKEMHKQHAIGRLFYETADLIKYNWDVEPHEVVPAAMRSQTPYSQALFLAFRWLAGNTKKHPEIAQKALQSVWQDRTGKLSVLEFSETRVELPISNPLCCETVIQECNYGLMLGDVLEAVGIGRKYAKGMGLALGPQPTGKLRGRNRGAPRAELRERRKEKKSKKQASRDADIKLKQDDVNVLAGAAKITKRERKQASKMRGKFRGEKGYKLLRFLQGDDDDEDGAVDGPGDMMTEDRPSGASMAPPNSPELNSIQPLHDPLEDMAMQDATKKDKTHRNKNNGDPADPDFAAHANKHDRHNDNMLSQMFNRVDMDSEHSLSGKRTRKLIAGASKKKVSLPTDRVRLAEIPTLHAQQGFKREAETLEGLEKMGLSTDQQDGVGRLTSDGVDGGVRLGQGEVIVLSDDDEL